MDIFLTVILGLLALVSLCLAGLFFLAMALCVVEGELCDALIILAFVIVFTAAFVTCAYNCSNLNHPAPTPKCRCAENYLAGVKNGVGVTLEAYTNTLHEAGIVMIPTGGRDE